MACGVHIYRIYYFVVLLCNTRLVFIGVEPNNVTSGPFHKISAHQHCHFDTHIFPKNILSASKGECNLDLRKSCAIFNDNLQFQEHFEASLHNHHHHGIRYAGDDPEVGDFTISEMSPEEIRTELKR